MAVISRRKESSRPCEYLERRSLSCMGERPPTTRANEAPSARICISPYSMPLCTCGRAVGDAVGRRGGRARSTLKERGSAPS
eukprot:scaffold117560_cov33-Tisochrysis_lutea.AAC.1